MKRWYREGRGHQAQGKEEGTHTTLNIAAVKPNHIYRSAYRSHQRSREHTAGPRFASVPPSSNALWAILHPYIDNTHAKQTRRVESHYESARPSESPFGGMRKGSAEYGEE